MLMTSQQGSAKIVSTYELMNTQIATSAAEALARIQSMMSSVGSKGGRRGTVGSAGGRGGTKGGRGGGRGGLVDKAGLFAAEGAFLTEPTELIAGELGDEIVMPFDESAGIPDDIMSKFGQGFYEGLENNLPMNRVNNADGGMREIIQALNNLQIGMNLTVQGVNIGSDISRQEIRNQFAQMQEAIVEIFDQSINAK